MEQVVLEQFLQGLQGSVHYWVKEHNSKIGNIVVQLTEHDLIAHRTDDTKEKLISYVKSEK